MVEVDLRHALSCTRELLCQTATVFQEANELVRVGRQALVAFDK
jgi:hypothetical protein